MDVGQQILMFRRGSRGTRRGGIRPVIQSYKKVIFYAEASQASGFDSLVIVKGVDGKAAEQTSATDTDIPTGSILKYFEVQFAISNLVSTPCYVNCTIQYKLSGQTFEDPVLVGGGKQRNQVLHMDMYGIGKDQNSNHKFKVKIPKQFQRIRDGVQWAVVFRTNATINRQMQVIYKFYR